jgi:magnesium-transporting ATPase (P-type)
VNPQSANQNNPQTNIEARILTLRIIWMALLMSVVIYYVITFFAARPADVAPNPALSIALICFAMLAILISFLIKNRLLSKAEEQRHLGMVQQAYVVTWAITEVAALLGLLDFFTTADRYHHALFIIAAVGLLFHFPRRESVVNAAFKSSF